MDIIRFGANALKLNLPEKIARDVAAFCALHNASDYLSRLEKRDASLWRNADESAWLGWLDCLKDGRENSDRYRDLASSVRDKGFKSVVVAGMGGSALGVRCLSAVMRLNDHASDVLPLYVIDSIFPQDVQEVVKKIDPTETLFIVASKSGSTLEANLLNDYFRDLVERSGGNPKECFIAITDPGTCLDKAREEWLEIFNGNPEIGGRYSAYSPFGLAPLAAAGYDIEYILRSLERVMETCLKADGNPALYLGSALGYCALEGRELVAPNGDALGRILKPWLEQLFAESLGKEGRGLIPVEPFSHENPDLFVLEIDREMREPVRTGAVLSILNPEDAVGILFLFELATAVAGSVLKINPFDQPDVEASKVACRAIMSQDIKRPAKEVFSADLEAFLKNGDLVEAISQRKAIALLAWVPHSERNKILFDRVARELSEKFHKPVSVSFGPSYLHSVGQAYKGAVNELFYIQVTQDPNRVKGDKLAETAFAQAQGDFNAMSARARFEISVCENGEIERELKSYFGF